MKKFLFICFIVITAVLTISCTKNNSGEYPYKRLDKDFTRFYSDEMKKKTPNLIEHENYEIYQGRNPFKITRDEKTSLYGILDNATGNVTIPNKYTNLKQCGYMSLSPYFQTRENGVFKVIDYNDNVIFKAKYDNVDCSNWYGILTKKGRKIGVVSFEGKEIKPKYDEIDGQEHFGESGGFYYIVKKGKKYGVFDNHGKIIIPMQNKPLFKNGTGPFFTFKENGKFGVIDIYKKVVVEPKYNKVQFKGSLDEDGYFEVCDNNGCGTMNLKGEQKLPNITGGEITRLAEGYYAVGKDQIKMDIINEQGEIQNKQSFQMIRPFNDKYALIFRFGVNNYGQGLIDFQGNIIMEPMDVSFIAKVSPNKVIKVEKNSLYGLVYNNKLIVPIDFDKIYFYKGHILIRYYKNNETYCYVGSFKDFENKNFNLNNLKSYKKSTLVSTNENCFKFTDSNGQDVEYCK